MTSSSSALPLSADLELEVVEGGVSDLDAIGEAARVCREAAAGNLEPRIEQLADNPKLAELALAINALLDSTDAYVRESAAALTAASERRYYRRMIERGMPGAFRRGATIINQARIAMSQEHDEVLASREARVAICDELQGVVRTSSERIGAVLDDISRIMKGTHVLALNAMIEAARAGEAGRGFSIVANEVKALADRISESMEGIQCEMNRFHSETLRVLDEIATSD